nr:competence type IV pilus ATPase ComGA [Thalassobacillus sp. CUG 92003]
MVSALQSTATDIHFSPYQENVPVHFRVHGKRIYHSSLTVQTYQKMLSYLKFVSGMDIGEIKRPQNGTLPFRNGADTFSLRLSTLPVTGNESLAIRVLPQSQHLPLEQLFLFPSQHAKIKQWLLQRNGVILLTGPTGSGKTTTLYALVQSVLSHHSYQAITLEDPIEKDLNNIIQVQVNERAGITYDAGLKAALRHDPDVIMVGEIRDYQTARFAFQAAQTGHLVISTIHAKNAFGTVLRLKDMGIAQSTLEQTLISIASQQLVTLTCGPHLPSRAAIVEIMEKEILSKALRNIPPEEQPSFQSFAKLRRRAYAYGFIDDNETL